MIRRVPIARRRSTLGAKRREAKAAGAVDRFSWQAVLEFYEFRCAYCLNDWQHMGHIVALARGGRHHISNVVPICARCNYRFRTRTVWPQRRHQFMEPISA